MRETSTTIGGPAYASPRGIPASASIAWGLTLLVSLLPDVLWKTVNGSSPPWLADARLALPAIVVAAGFVWRPARPLRFYALMLLTLLLAEELRGILAESPRWQGWFGGSGFGREMLGSQILRVWAAFVMIGALALLRFRPGDCFIVRGDLNAPAAPVRWLGITGVVTWKRLGPISAACIGLGTLAFLVAFGRPALPALMRTAPLVPLVLVLAAMNAFGEEVMYRAALLAPAIRALGTRQGIYLTAAFFGINHYYGVPYGVLGVVMASLLGWFLGKCMVETKGLFWPWFIHFVQDVAIFTFMAMGAATPGGR